MVKYASCRGHAAPFLFFSFRICNILLTFSGSESRYWSSDRSEFWHKVRFAWTPKLRKNDLPVSSIRRNYVLYMLQCHTLILHSLTTQEQSSKPQINLPYQEIRTKPELNETFSFSEIMSCSLLAGHVRFGRDCCHHIQSRRIIHTAKQGCRIGACKPASGRRWPLRSAFSNVRVEAGKLSWRGLLVKWQEAGGCIRLWS